ncbi:sigma-70 family RNA polymerase sigma factor [Sediminibacillus dalangtanensis]|uniref:Sigma-70 family RNA polymerase sigma factor n=1 Tax=Sediminibacillus dalangtanensis TaxID=2729421 RepID=A0ABX7VZG5_9BACI|nr:sigma-70 family RNA polymerase sigma factor [Sediminibacillus dalangtanensis]QTN01129.1 sigma-70 family RNA polymerase sigma factor [Sediminibacillus dalangtanensis]
MEYQCQTKERDDLIKKFMEENQEFVNQPIVQSFLAEKKNKNLLVEALSKKSEESYYELDQAFRIFYQKARLMKYLSSLVYYNSINFDKKIRKQKERQLPILNQPVKGDSENSNDELIDILAGDLTNLEEKVLENSNNLEDHIQNEDLYHAILSLSANQKEVLEYVYLHRLKNKEIALIKRTTPQNISQIHNQAIQKIKKQMNGRRKI